MEAKRKVKVYIKANYQGKPYRVLDTGCDISILSTKVIPNISFQTSERSLYAANFSNVLVLERVTVSFGIADSSIESEFLTDAILEKNTASAMTLSVMSFVSKVISVE